MGLTLNTVREIGRNHKYIAVRKKSGAVAGINCGIFSLSKFLNIPDKETWVESYYPISFNEYISIKVTFK